MIVKNTYTPPFFDTLLCRDFDAYINFDFTVSDKIEKIYNTEIILITNSNSLKNLFGFIQWYIDILKFEHIVLIDNYPTNRASDFEDFSKVSYEHKPGILSQSKIYTEYVNKSKAKWVLPIDDDEFLYISEKFNHNINTFLKSMMNDHFSYKYSFEWHMMFSNTLYQNMPDDLYLNKYIYTTFGLNTKIDNINLIKTIVNTDIKHLYCNDNATPCLIDAESTKAEKLIIKDKEPDGYNVTGTVHNPLSKDSNNIIHESYNYTANKKIKGLYYVGPLNINSDIFIAHYKYRSATEYQNKITNYKFPDILSKYVNSNYRISTIYDAYNSIKNNCAVQPELFNLYNQYINNL